MTIPVLKVQNLKKSLRSRTSLKSSEVLRGINFELERGAITGFLGSNGAGKTTTIKCLLGLIFPDEGEISFFGEGYNTSEIKRRIGFLPERPYFYEYLTGDEYLKFCGELMGISRGKELHNRVDEVLDLVELQAARGKSLREYSKGMLQRIGIAQAIIHKPEFILLDEPMSGLDPDGRYKVNEILRELGNRGTTVFFSSHLLHDAEVLCKNLVIVAKGQVVYQGAMESLLKRLQVGYVVTYREGDKILSSGANTEAELQVRIEDILRRKLVILEVKSDRPSLEKAFVKISAGGL